MDRAYRTEAVVDQDGAVRLHDLPFGPGEAVDIIVVSRPPTRGAPPSPLRGTVLRYDDPTEPVAVDAWDALG